MHAIELVEGVAVDRERVGDAIDHAAHAVFVWPPCGEARKEVEYSLIVRMENVRAVWVHQHTMGVVLVVSVAANVRSLVDEQHRAPLIGQRTGYRAA
jgi:hypothetical protein